VMSPEDSNTSIESELTSDTTAGCRPPIEEYC